MAKRGVVGYASCLGPGPPPSPVGPQRAGVPDQLLPRGPRMDGSRLLVGSMTGSTNAMKPPTFVGSLTAEDRQHLEAGLHSPDAFTLRRSQILLASARGYRPSQIAPVLGCSIGSVRNAIY